jgi:hypothetical protein
MVAKLSPLAWAFAGGCLSGATLIGVVVIGFVREDAGTIPKDAPMDRTAERYREPRSVDPADEDAPPTVGDDERNAESHGPTPPKQKAESAVDHPADEGHSIADILLRLEAAYRNDLGSPSPRAATPTNEASQRETAARELPAHAETAVAVAAPPAPPASAQPVAAPPRAPEAEAQPVLVAVRDDAPTNNVYYGDVQQNTNVGSVQQGDVYVMPPVVPYAPYYALGSSARSAPGASGSHLGIPRAVHFTKNPNPAGSGVFNYSIDGPFKYPVDLVH